MHISKKTSKLCVTVHCEGNSPVSGEFPVQRVINAKNASFWWRHHGASTCTTYTSTIFHVRHTLISPIVSFVIFTIIRSLKLSQFRIFWLKYLGGFMNWFFQISLIICEILMISCGFAPKSNITMIITNILKQIKAEVKWPRFRERHF